MKKILLVEDDVGISHSLKLYLQNSDFEVDLHYSGEKAVKKILEGKHDIIILDVNLPHKDGIQICKEVREKSSVPIVMLTARTSEMDKITGLEIGADDYIPKPFSPRELLARINVILRRVNMHSESSKEEENILELENIKIIKDKRLVEVNGEEAPLTKNEYDLLVRITNENGKVISRETLMSEVMGYDNYVYDRTLDTHIKNLRRKIQNKDLILTVRGEGYRLNK